LKENATKSKASCSYAALCRQN